MERPQSAFSKITNFFRGNVKQPTMIWRQSGEKEEWRKKATEAIIKKLKTQTNGVANIKRALTSRSVSSDCVTIPRSLDGRLQVAQCKLLPHVMACRVWRWPDLQNYNELKAVPNCKYPYAKAMRSEDICINPYHYERIENKVILPPILVPRCSEFAPGYSKIPAQQTAGTNMSANSAYTNQFSPVSSYLTNSPCSSNENNSPTMFSNQMNNGMQQQQQQQQLQQQQPQQQHLQQQQEPLPQHHQQFQPQQQQFQQNQHQNTFQYPTYNQQQPQQMQNYQYPPVPEVNLDNIPMDVDVSFNQTIQVHYEDPEIWASVAYYELNSRVGEQYKCNSISKSLIVDGFTQPSSKTENRFCLGQLSNISRNSTIESTRKHIGKGVKIFCNENQIYLECLSEAPVFIQSSMANFIHNFETNTVLKLMPKQSLKIFDHTEFANLLSEVVVSGGFEETYRLTNLCTIRISFVKGWGAQYHRQDITSTPCWIELHLNGPLKWLDDVLIQMGSPLYNITSVS